MFRFDLGQCGRLRVLPKLSAMTLIFVYILVFFSAGLGVAVGFYLLFIGVVTKSKLTLATGLLFVALCAVLLKWLETA